MGDYSRQLGALLAQGLPKGSSDYLDRQNIANQQAANQQTSQGRLAEMMRHNLKAEEITGKRVGVSDMRMALSAYKDLQNRLTKLTSEEDKAIEVNNTLNSLLNDPNAVNKGHIRTLLGVIEQRGYRPMMGTIQTAGGPVTAVEALTDILNKTTGDDLSGKPAQQIRDIAKTMQQHFQPTVESYLQKTADLSEYARQVGAKAGIPEEDLETAIYAPLKARTEKAGSVSRVTSDIIGRPQQEPTSNIPSGNIAKDLYREAGSLAGKAKDTLGSMLKPPPAPLSQPARAVEPSPLAVPKSRAVPQASAYDDGGASEPDPTMPQDDLDSMTDEQLKELYAKSLGK